MDQAYTRQVTLSLDCGMEGAKQHHFKCQVLLMTQASGIQSPNPEF